MSEFLETFDARQIAHDADALKKLVHHYTAAVSSKVCFDRLYTQHWQLTVP